MIYTTIVTSLEWPLLHVEHWINYLVTVIELSTYLLHGIAQSRDFQLL